MENRKIGLIVIGISVVLFFITLYLTQTIMELRVELHKNCPLPLEECFYKSSVPMEVLAAFTIIAILGSFGTFLIFAPKPAVSRQTKKLRKAAKGLQGDERKVYNAIVASDGLIFQGELINKTGFSKVKVTRVLDKLEAKGLVERRRRGMSNVVIAS